MEDSLQKKYPEVGILRAAVEKHRLRFELDNTFEVDAANFITVKMQAAEHQFVVPLMDEFGDFNPQKPTLALHLVLLACEDFEEAEDYLVWCKALELNASEVNCRTAWFHLRDEVPKIRVFLGKQVKAVDSFDYQMGAGATQLLRQIDTPQ